LLGRPYSVAKFLNNRSWEIEELERKKVKPG
jgi:hypothetical protein